MATFRAKGAKKVVLGAWGCGAYGNPVHEIAAAWKHVLLGSRQPSLDYSPEVSEIVFAINDRRMAQQFADAFGDIAFHESDKEVELGEDDTGPGEIQSKIDELERSLSLAKRPELRDGLSRAIASLRAQLQ